MCEGTRRRASTSRRWPRGSSPPSTSPFVVAGTEVFLTASVGVSTAPAGEVGTDQLLRQAEAAGQMAKQRGGGTVHHFDEDMQARALRRAEVEDALRGATERERAGAALPARGVAAHQPDRRRRGAGALAAPRVGPGGARRVRRRWPRTPTSSSSSAPGCSTPPWTSALGGAPRSATPTPTVAINISARQFLQDDFVELVATTLERTGADPADICLEITESVLMDDVDLTVATLRRLKGARRAAGRRRLRHRLLVAVLPAPVPGRRAQGRPVLRERPRPRPGGLRHRAGGGRHGPGAAAHHRGRGRGDRPPPHRAPRARLRHGPGVPLRPAPARPRRSAACSRPAPTG